MSDHKLTNDDAVLFVNLPALTFSKDTETGKYLACSQSFAEYAHKESPDEVVGLTNNELFDEGTAASLAESDNKALSMREPYIFFEDVPDPSGSLRHLQTTKQQFTDPSGRPCLLGLCVDVTETVYWKSAQAVQRADEAESRASHAESRASHAESRISEAESRASHAESRASHAESRISEAESRADKAESRASHAESRASHAESLISEAENRADEAESRASHAESRASHAESLISEAENRADEAESQIHEAKQSQLAERLALQETIREQEMNREQQARMITALASDYWSVYYLELDKNEGVCYQSHSDVDDGFKVGEHFPYLESVTAYAKENITEPYLDEFLDFIQPDNIRSELKEQRVISYTYMVNRHGEETYEAVRFAVIRHPGEDPDAPVNTVSACFADVDLETRKRAEHNQALIDALAAAEQANKAKTAFLSNMSHEIRTPMNAIIGLNNIALNDPEISDKTREYLDKIGISAKHLLNIINDILDMSRIESGRMVLKNEEFSFSKTLEQVNTMISGQCRDKNLNFECRINGKIDDHYVGDDMKLRQVMINLLGNAVKFTPSGGSVTFIIEEVAKFQGKSTLRLIIEDTGIGISKDYIPHIFDPFSQEDSSATNKYGSTGLGMPITKSIVELMNGHIEVESEKGSGTTFTVTITLTDSQRKTTHTIEEGVLHPHEMSVLVIDDDAIACEHAQVVLGHVGIACDTAASGAEGVEMVKLRHGRRDPYDLILVDWKMPEMDGLETSRKIRSIVGHDCAIIILTSYNWDDIADKAIKAGVDSFVPKPLFAATVMDEFRDAFKKKNAALLASKADLKGRRILLAEDMVVNAEIMVMVLSMREMDVDVAENGRIAVEEFSSHPAGYYDAILMDMRMPEMDGLEATRRIRALDREDAKSIPIIALTANAFDEDVQRSMQAGLNAHLSKPVEAEALFETLESLIMD